MSTQFKGLDVKQGDKYLCTVCFQYKKFDEFHKASKKVKSRDNLKHYCILCERKKKKEYWDEIKGFSNEKRRLKNGIETRKCKCGCGEEFTTTNSKKLYINKKHKNNSWNQQPDKKMKQSIREKAIRKVEKRLRGRINTPYSKEEDKLLKRFARDKFKKRKTITYSQLGEKLGRTSSALMTKVSILVKEMRIREINKKENEYYGTI